MSPIRISGKGKAIAILSAFALMIVIVAEVQSTEVDATVCKLTLVPGGGSFTVENCVEESENNYSCTIGDIITMVYNPEGSVSCVSDWGYDSNGGNIKVLKETAFMLMFSLSGDKTITPSLTTTGIKKVSTWQEMVSCGVDSSVTTIIVDTENSLASMTTTQMVIDHDLRIVGNNSSGTNGFIRISPTVDGSDNVIPTIRITSGKVSFSGVTLDGGAIWKNTSDDNVHKMIQITLQRGDDNIGVKTDQPFISNDGSLYLLDDLIIQNAYNTFTSADSNRNGGALYSGGYVSFNGALIKDCYALRGSAAYCIMSGGAQLVIEGNTVITHNGGLNCELGSAIYVKEGSILIESGKVNENFGAFAFVSGTGVTITGGEICRNVSKAADESHCNGQDRYCGVFYMYNSGTTFKMEGGYIMDNKTYKTSDSAGRFNGIVFQSSGTVNMTGGTICDNAVYTSFSISDNDVSWSDGTGCDVKFGSQSNSVGTLTMTGGSLESVFNGTSTVSMNAISVSGSSGAGTVIESLKGSDGNTVSWDCTDMVTDSTGKVYVLLSTEGISAVAKVSISLDGRPVIDGNPMAGNTLSVIFSQTSNYTCKWYIREDPTSDPVLISNHTTYVVKTEDYGKLIHVVLYGTNGYVGNVTSDPVEVYIQFVIMYDCGGSGSTIPNGVFEYTPGDIVKVTVEKPSWDSGEPKKHFIGWFFAGDGKIYAPGADFDPSPYLGGSNLVTMSAKWEDNPVNVYSDQGKVWIYDTSDHVSYDNPTVPEGKVFVGWRCGSTIYATGQPLVNTGEVRHFEAVFIDETYHGTLEIGSTTPST